MENRVWQLSVIIGGPEKAHSLFLDSAWPEIAELFVNYDQNIQSQNREILDQEVPLEAAIWASERTRSTVVLTETGTFSTSALEGDRVRLSEVVTKYGAGFAEQILEKGSNHPDFYRTDSGTKSRQSFDDTFGHSTTLSMHLQTNVDPTDVMSYLGIAYQETGIGLEASEPVRLRVGRVADLPAPAYYDGFGKDSLYCCWLDDSQPSDADQRKNCLARLSQVFRLLRWDDSSFGALWVGERPTIVWDDTGVHLFTDEDFLGRMPGLLLLDHAERHKITYRQHRRTLADLPASLPARKSERPLPKQRLTQRADWSEIAKPKNHLLQYLSKQESIDVVFAWIKQHPGRTIYSIDQAINVSRLHQDRRLPNILDHLEQSGTVRTKVEETQKRYYPSSSKG